MAEDGTSLACASSAKEHEVAGCPAYEILGLSLVDGILVEADGIPIHAVESDDDENTEGGFSATDEESSASVTAVERLAIDDIVLANKLKWTCPGESSEGRTCSAPGKNSRCTHSSYGTSNAESMADLEDMIGPNVDGGLIFTLKVLPNDYNSKGENNLKILSSKDYNVKAKIPKARRKMPFPITSNDFYNSLHRIGSSMGENDEAEDEEGYGDLWDRNARSISAYKSKEASPPRWLFTGVINGWPGLPMPLEVLKITGREPSFIGRHAKGWSTLWDCEKDGKFGGKAPYDCKIASEEKGLQVKVKLRASQWSAHGWSQSSPGFVYWVEGQHVGGKVNPPLTVTYGTNLISRFKCPEEEDIVSTRVHMISHRYATGGRVETQKEKLTYHSLVLLEWNHKKYCSVVEIGFLNGLGGYKCKSSWYADKDSEESSLYVAYPPEMVSPWKETMSEIRVHDVPYADLNAFLGFMKKYDGHQGRFVDTSVNFSHDVRLTYRSRRNVATYLLNYIRRDTTYSQMKRNCQTFAADLCGFLAGKKDVQPYHPVNQIQYTGQKHKFLYESSAY